MNNDDDLVHNFSTARRGSAIGSRGKTRVTMYLDDDVLEHFRDRASQKGRGYQTEINACLRQSMGGYWQAESAQLASGVLRVNVTGTFARLSASDVHSVCGGVTKAGLKSIRDERGFRPQLCSNYRVGY
jgi:post-segregation antitoxin (ccd killing protein)